VQAYVARDFSQLEGSMLFQGRYPEHTNEVAIGGLLSEATGSAIGDRAVIRRGAVERVYLVTGIVQLADNAGINIMMTHGGLVALNRDFQFTQLYVYLERNSDVNDFLARVEEAEGDVFTSAVDMQELIDARFSQYGAIFAAVAFGIMLVTLAVVGLVLYMVIRTAIWRRRQEFGVYKALGHTTIQLMTQVALNFTPIVLLGLVLGSVAGYLGFNPLFALLTHSVGVVKTNLPTPLGLTVVTCAELTLYAFEVSWLIAWRIRKISPYALVGV